MGWKVKTLSELTTHLGDGLHGTPKYSEDGDYYFVNGNNLANGKIVFKDKTKRISIDEYTKYKKNLTDRTVLVSINGTLGNVAFYNNEKIILGKSACYFNLLDTVDKKYIKHIISSPYFLEYAHQEATGATIKNVSLKTMRAFKIPIPPLEEQKRIVALLDTVFADLAQTRAKTEQNLKNARELFDSYLQQVFSQKGEGWVETTLGEISKVSYGYTEKASFDRNGPHFLRITDIQDGEVDWSKVPFCPISEADHEKHRLLSGDIVFARTGATTGKSYLLTSPPDSVAASYLIRLRLHSDSLFPKFVKFFFQTKEYWDVVNAGMSGSAQGGFNASKLSAMKIKYPESKNEQNKLIQKLTEIHQYVEQVNAIYKQKLTAIDELKKSILQKAFNGELTTTEINSDR